MSLQGWAPEIGPYVTLEDVIEHAFDYRGNTTIVKRDGSELVGYLFNRNASAPAPFVEYFDEEGAGPFTVPYAEIATIRFSGKDTAAGNSWKAWIERREREQTGKAGRRADGESAQHADPGRD